jgi:hypothetical protein
MAGDGPNTTSAPGDNLDAIVDGDYDGCVDLIIRVSEWANCWGGAVLDAPEAVSAVVFQMIEQIDTGGARGRIRAALHDAEGVVDAARANHTASGMPVRLADVSARLLPTLTPIQEEMARMRTYEGRLAALASRFPAYDPGPPAPRS